MLAKYGITNIALPIARAPIIKKTIHASSECVRRFCILKHFQIKWQSVERPEMRQKICSSTSLFPFAAAVL